MATPQAAKNVSAMDNTVLESHESSTLRIMSHNCFGLKYISQHRRARLTEIGHAISLLYPRPQIVGLQECWTQEDYASIRSATSSILPYGKFYYSGIFGGGLAILSAFPIEDSSMYRYPLNGRPTAFFRGDWFVGKGVACARIRLPARESSDGEKGQGESVGDGDIVEVFCTHLHAPYEAEPGDSYLCHRTAQAWEIAKLMRGATERGHLVIGLGDFNMLPLSLAHRVITARGNVVDAWRALHPDSSLGPATFPAEKERRVEIPSAQLNLEVNGAASDSVLNTWRWEKSRQKAQYGKKGGPAIDVPTDTPDPRAKRLDYIFIGNGRHRDVSPSAASHWKVTDMRVGMTQLHPTIHCSLSDHFSIHATITRSPAATPTGTASQMRTQDLQPQDEKILIFKRILALIQTYTTRELFQRKARLTHFLFWLIVSIGYFVAIWFSPRPFVSFILALFITLGFAVGVVDGLIGGLFMSSELRALKEFEWEVSNAIAVAGERRVVSPGEGDKSVNGNGARRGCERRSE